MRGAPYPPVRDGDGGGVAEGVAVPAIAAATASSSSPTVPQALPHTAGKSPPRRPVDLSKTKHVIR